MYFSEELGTAYLSCTVREGLQDIADVFEFHDVIWSAHSVDARHRMVE